MLPESMEIEYGVRGVTTGGAGGGGGAPAPPIIL